MRLWLAEEEQKKACRMEKQAAKRAKRETATGEGRHEQSIAENL
jgi:hypothetical protein